VPIEFLRGTRTAAWKWLCAIGPFLTSGFGLVVVRVVVVGQNEMLPGFQNCVAIQIVRLAKLLHSDAVPLGNLC
jgi:hypothetical protein